MTGRPAAASLLRLGYHLVPLRAGTKQPAGGVGWQGRIVRSPDAATRLKGGNVGVLGGSPVRPGRRLLVVDIDGKGGAGGFDSGRRLEGIYGRFPATATVWTPTGGLHLHYLVPADLPLAGISRLLQTLGFAGIDLIGDGLFAVAPPSTLPAGPYSWLHPPSDGLSEAPVWLQHLLRLGGRPGRPERPRTQGNGLRGPTAGQPLAGDLQGLLEHILRRYPVAGPGQRNDRMHRAVLCLLNKGLPPEQVRSVMLGWHERQAEVIATPFEEAAVALDQCLASTLRKIEQGGLSVAVTDHLAAQREYVLSPRQLAFLNRLPAPPSLPPSAPAPPSLGKGGLAAAGAGRRLTSRERQFVDVLVVLAAYERAKPGRCDESPDEFKATNQQMLDLLLARHGIDLKPRNGNEGAGSRQFRRLKELFVATPARQAVRVELVRLVRQGERGEASVYRLTGLFGAFDPDKRLAGRD